ncbi:MAG: hypothetical protein QOG93_2434, partial [Gaiellaceae bacterium]|nr:hypothetical protein [Gaiellaceae bacterium]
MRERGRRARGDTGQEPLNGAGATMNDALLVIVIVVALGFDF